MTPQPSSPVVCTSCGTEGTGRFCANCGATLTSGKCASCGAALSPGAHFCHRCGTPVGAGIAPAEITPDSPRKTAAASSLPWAVAAIALLALVAMSAGRFFSSSGGSPDAPQNSPPGAGEAAGGAPTMRLPDISSMSPEEQADRLFNRVMLLQSEGKTDSVRFFAPMAIEAYQMLSPLSADQRYDMGRIAEVTGALPLAKAQADTILRGNPDHLLGLILAARVASLLGDSTARRHYESKFLAVEKAEVGKKLPEYDRHQNDITAAMANARPSPGRKE